MELFVKQDIIKRLPQLDAILLDVDGVILDVAQTFRVVASLVSQLYVTQWLKLEDDGVFFDASECELFKLAGGFNNDWDLTNAVVALAIAKHACNPEITTALELRAATPSWAEYADQLKREGGGVVTAQKIAVEMLTPQQRRIYANFWKPKLVTRLFQEMYAGDAQCHALYGFTPEYIHEVGYLDKETVIIDATLLPAKTKFGVLTGRTKAETDIALHRAGLHAKVPESAWVTEDDGVRKPSGEALALLHSRMGFKHGVYIGDTMDDLHTVQNFKETNTAGAAQILSCIVLSGPAGDTHRRLFLEAGAEIVAPDVNAVLTYLGRVLK